MANLKYFKTKVECENYISQFNTYPFVGYAEDEQKCLMGTSADDLTWYDSFPHVPAGGLTATEVMELVNHSLNDFLSLKSDDGKVNTYQEVVEYVQEHEGSYQELVEDVQQLGAEISSIEITGSDDIDSLF